MYIRVNTYQRMNAWPFLILHRVCTFKDKDYPTWFNNQHKGQLFFFTFKQSAFYVLIGVIEIKQHRQIQRAY